MHDEVIAQAAGIVIVAMFVENCLSVFSSLAKMLAKHTEMAVDCTTGGWVAKGGPVLAGAMGYKGER